MVTRRRFFQVSAALGAGLLVPLKSPSSSSAAPLFRRHARAVHDERPPLKANIPVPGGTLDPLLIPKYQMPLIIPPAMPRTSQLPGSNRGRDDRLLRDRRPPIRAADPAALRSNLPAQPGWPVTTVWSYGSANHPGTFNYPAFTIEAKLAAARCASSGSTT